MAEEKLPTKRELQQSIHKWKLSHQQLKNEDMDKLFERSNLLEQKLHSDLIVFASVMLTIMGGVIASRDISLTMNAKIALTGGVLALLASICAGLASYKAMSNFWLIWARAKHESGRMIEEDESQTHAELAALRKKLMDYEGALPETSSKFFARIHMTFFVSGLLLVVASILGLLFDVPIIK